MCLHGIVVINLGQPYLFLYIQSDFPFIHVSLMIFCTPQNTFHWTLHDTIFRTVVLWYCQSHSSWFVCCRRKRIMTIHIKEYHHSSLISFEYLSISSIFQSVQIHHHEYVLWVDKWYCQGLHYFIHNHKDIIYVRILHMWNMESVDIWTLF